MPVLLALKGRDMKAMGIAHRLLPIAIAMYLEHWFANERFRLNFNNMII